MPTVTENVDLPAGVEPSRVLAEIQLYQAANTPLAEAYNSSTQKTIAGRHVVALDATGAWTLALDGNDDLTPTGTTWGRRIIGPQVDDAMTSYAEVATSGGPYVWKAIETDPPAALAPSGLSPHAADGLLHGGGQLLAYADRSTSFTTTATSATDVTGVTITFTVPDGPYVVECGAFVLIEEGRQGAVAISSGSRTSGVSTMNTSAAHGLAVGRTAYVSTADTTYNGTWSVASVPTTTQFTYAQTGVSNDASSGTGVVAPIETPGAGGTIQIALSDNTVIGQDGGRAKLDNDLMFLNRRVPVPNWTHIPTPGATITYKLRALSTAASSDFSLIGPFIGFNDAPYIMAYTLRGS